MKQIIAILAVLLSTSFGSFSQQSDAELRQAVGDDLAGRDQRGKLKVATPAEHLRKAELYSANRMFPQAREHWQIVFDNFPGDPGVPKALFGTARSYMWERDYEKAVKWFDKLLADYANTKEGREGLAFKGASLVRLGRNLDAARVYQQYIVMFPAGERIESAHLNLIDAYREAGRYNDAERWVNETARKFKGKPAEANALHAALRMEIYRQNWKAALENADRLLALNSLRGSMASSDEIKYLKALATQLSGKRAEAAALFESLGRNDLSYFGGLAREKAKESIALPVNGSRPNFGEFPLMYRTELLAAAKRNKIDPRFLLAIMKQESSFRPAAKSPAGARGLLQLVFDTALKYKDDAGFPKLLPDDLYNPATNIAIGSAYIGALKNRFGGLYEAIAASYNGGEDNAERWLKRSKPVDAGVFTAEIGFAETKAYVIKVMNNYRAYRQLYAEDLNAR